MWRVQGVIKGCNIFLGQILANTCRFVGGSIIVWQEKISRAEHSSANPLNALQEVIYYSVIKFCIYCFSVWYVFSVHYALESRKKLSTLSRCGTFGISASLAEGMSHQPIENTVIVFWGHRQNTRSHLPQ
jgi:hypothetical protein